MKESSEQKICFIICQGRSGSTLLSFLLHRHTNIISPPESRLIVGLKSTYQKTLINSENSRRFLADLYSDYKFRKFWKIRPQRLKEAFFSTKPTPFQEAVFKIFSSFSPQKEATVICDKNPIYSLFLPELIRLFPNAVFIHLIRNPMAIVNSHLKFKPHDDPRIIAYRYLYMNKIIENFKQQHAEQFHTLKYEDLASNSEIHLTKICNFLGVPFEKKMLHHTDHAEDIYEQIMNDDTITPAIRSHIRSLFPKISQPVSEKYIQQWKEFLPHKIICETKQITAEYGEKYGYFKTVRKKTNLWEVLKYLFKFKLWQLKHKVYYSLPLKARKMVNRTKNDTNI